MSIISDIETLLSRHKQAEHLYEEQAIAMELLEKYGHLIVNALRAGEAMREAMELSEFDSGYVEGWVRSKDYYIAGKALQAWDAATKEEV
jgi:hypothetical protein